MRSSIRMFTLSAVLVLGLASWGVAQMMMGGSTGHMQKTKADSTSLHEGAGMMGMMSQMSDRCYTMTDQIDTLDQNFQKMMKMHDMNALKAEMQKQEHMIQAMHNSMMKQNDMWHEMMSMSLSEGMPGMMGMMDYSHPEVMPPHPDNE